MSELKKLLDLNPRLSQLSCGESSNITQMKRSEKLNVNSGIDGTVIYKKKGQFIAGEAVDGTKRKKDYATIFKHSEAFEAVQNLSPSAGKMFQGLFAAMVYYNYVAVSTKELAEIFRVNPATVSRNLKELKDSKVISLVRLSRRDKDKLRYRYKFLFGEELPAGAKWYKITPNYCWKGNPKYYVNPPAGYKVFNRTEEATKLSLTYGWPTALDGLMEETRGGKWMARQYRELAETLENDVTEEKLA